VAVPFVDLRIASIVNPHLNDDTCSVITFPGSEACGLVLFKCTEIWRITLVLEGDSLAC
jgi:hypothetical protein